MSSSIRTATTMNLATCPGLTATSRKQADNTGSGKTWRIGSYMYGSNDIDDAGEANRNACKSFEYYDGLHDGTLHIDMGTSSHGVTSQNMKTLAGAQYNFIKDGHTKDVQPPHKVGSKTLSGDEVDSYEFTAMNVLSPGFGAENNWTRTCMKNNNGYLWGTNPYDGKPMGSSTRAGTKSISTSSRDQKKKFHKDACCGFHNNGDLAPGNSNYCHTSYCNVSGAVTTGCRERLAELCNNKDEFSNNKNCAMPFFSYLNNNAWLNAENLDSAARASAQAYSKSLTDGDYRRIGKNICKKTANGGKSPFEPVDDDDSDANEKNKLREACIKWCSINPDECKDEIVNFCGDVYDESVFDNDGKATPRFLASQNVCGCNWPDDFYTGMRDTFIKDWNVPASSVSNQRHCVNASCATARIGDTQKSGLGGIYSPGGAGGSDCPDQNIINCIQEVNVDVEGDITVTDGGSFVFKPEMDNNCSLNMTTEEYNAMANHYNNTSNTTTNNTTNTTLSKNEQKLQELYLLDEEGKISIFSILLIMCCCCCCFFLISMVIFASGDDNSNSNESTKKCSDGDLDCKLERELDS